MKRLPRKILFKTIKALLAKSGNQCAFPNCNHALFNSNNLFISQLCHIEAISPEGPRYNPYTTTEKVNSYDNPILLCYQHHKETDDTSIYNTEKLRQIKCEHENRFKAHKFELVDNIVKRTLDEINDYWETVEQINSQEHIAPDFKVEIQTYDNEIVIINNINKQMKSLDKMLSDLIRKSKIHDFELICLAIPNTMTRLNVLLEQLEIRIFELKLINEPSKESLRKELNQLRENFKKTAKNAGLWD